MDKFKFKITLDRHNAIQNLNYYDLPDPPRFSLQSTFKLGLLAGCAHDEHLRAVWERTRRQLQPDQQPARELSRRHHPLQSTKRLPYRP
jgi:hypothetical protein